MRLTSRRTTQTTRTSRSWTGDLASDGVVRIRFPLLPWQVKARALRATRPLVVINGGVHTGKTVWATIELVHDLVTHPGQTFWWVAGQRFQLEAMWNALKPLLGPLRARIKQHPLLRAELPNGACVYGVSAENLDAIASHHPRAIYGDEVAKWRQQAYQLVRLRLLGSQPTRGLFLSTPRPNFWREMVRAGQEAKDGRWGYMHVTTPQAGLISAGDIEAIRHDLPDELFRQEIMAEVLEGAGSVFTKVRAAATGQPEAPVPARRYTIGYDPAKLRDFAVVAVRREGRLVWLERWTKLPYTEQAERVTQLAHRYGVSEVTIDAGGPGEAAAEMLEARRIWPRRVTFTNALKEQYVNAMVLRFEQGQIVLPSPSHGPAYQALVDELTAFERCRTDAGLHYTYGAPEGSHDDCVTALMLAFGQEAQRPVSILIANRPRQRYVQHSWIRTDYGD